MRVITGGIFAMPRALSLNESAKQSWQFRTREFLALAATATLCATAAVAALVAAAAPQ